MIHSCATQSFLSLQFMRECRNYNDIIRKQKQEQEWQRLQEKLQEQNSIQQVPIVAPKPMRFSRKTEAFLPFV